ncbi:MAG: hypothetical protein IT373_08050 [Polyangiaceae bacterium]|nr:hypothetical protein [Polyangiaceae bacterium]
MFEVWCNDGGDRRVEAKFRLLRDAVRFVRSHEAPERLTIRAPDGRWLAMARGEGPDAWLADRASDVPPRSTPPSRSTPPPRPVSERSAPPPGSEPPPPREPPGRRG